MVRATYTALASLPGASLVLTLSEPTPALTMGAIVVLLFLVPDGRPLNRVWRAATWAALDGTLEVKSRPGAGTTLEGRVPTEAGR